ncbi:hypothetical protein [Jiella sp. M17.18]|uniref:hypothetical protein n=1 Tax=Jiella sp. M17.18 TaxID=3234247 RepID=UPI0034DFDBCD
MRFAIIVGLLLVPAAAQAQEQKGGGGLFGTGLFDGGLFGGSAPEKPGAYVSPSASDLVPAPKDVGAPPLRPLRSYNPIALPKRSGSPIAPKIDLPGLPAYAPQPTPPKDMMRSQATLTLSAKLTDDGPVVSNGLVWRLFAAVPSIDGRPSLIASSENSVADFNVPTGSYILHVAFGRAGLVQRIDFTGVRTRETVVLNAGGLRLNALVKGGKRAIASKLSFDIYSDAKDGGDRKLIASDVPPDKVVRLNAGTYHVVSSYGSVNASVRADIRVEAGKITDATLQQHAALLTLKLVREHGGEAIADTAWSISTASGDVVKESVGAFPSMVLAEGDYLIVAKNHDKVYQRQFSVHSGENTDVEVTTADIAADQDGSDASTD